MVACRASAEARTGVHVCRRAAHACTALTTDATVSEQTFLDVITARTAQATYYVVITSKDNTTRKSRSSRTR